MDLSKGLLRYVAILLLFGSGVVVTLRVGAGLHSDQPVSEVSKAAAVLTASPEHTAKASSNIASALWTNLRHPVSLLLVQVIVILVVARVVGMFLRKAGQPVVVGEMIAGILLGPSFLGMLSPETMTFLFPPQSLGSLGLLSQIGIITFMFVVGMELNLKQIRRKAHAAVLVSHASIIVPFFFGTVFSLLIYRSFAPGNVNFTAFALFMSVAMSITAFPVLARILEDRGLTRTSLGSTAIACAAVDDVTAWCILAAVISIAKASGLSGVAVTILLTFLFIALMLFVLKPRIARLPAIADFERQTQRGGLVAMVLAFVLASALFTEIIGIHALFGAFLAGVVMPSDSGLRKFLAERLEVITSCFLLPLFFAFTGLRTQIGLLNDWSSWVLCAVVIAVAIAGKLGGSALAARWAGMSWSESLSLGVLMNTRGLVELIVLNIGYDLGILSPRLFSMMVIMAITTTFMTGPLLSLVEFWRRKQLEASVPSLSLAADQRITTEEEKKWKNCIRRKECAPDRSYQESVSEH